MLVVVELSTILSGLAKDWVDFSRLGHCYLPEVVWREVEFLTLRAVTEKEEKIAREFTRFFPDSGWQIISDMSPLPMANILEGMDMSKKARLLMGIAETVYDFTLKNPQELIVLVTSETNLKTQLKQLNLKNLAIITPNQLKNWLKTGVTPPTIAETAAACDYTIAPPSPQPTDTNHPRLLLQNTSSNVFFPATRRRQRGENPLFIVIHSISAIVFLLVAVGLTWYLISPQSFQDFLRLPLPGNSQKK
ncbi:MAG: hypothetical protein NZ901_04175 [Geminocystis sp.]|nr:hypothetical protein [Geminocystis sp.]MCS7147369.1 hypothetical protein [Geminocystis sp.]MDW8116368.1 PIN domain-containing protein [Geminocystis sp.]MDW8462642.1 PIN domain-containing protein [Geminocystis sp.]